MKIGGQGAQPARRNRPQPIHSRTNSSSCGKGGFCYRNPSMNLLIRLLKSGSFLRRSSTFRIEWITVE